LFTYSLRQTGKKFVRLSQYQTAGFQAVISPPAALNADMIRRSDASKVIRFGGRANLCGSQQRNLRRRTLAQFRATLLSPNVKLFMTTSSSTFVFILGFLS
jgi:hypothetical protein